MGIERGWKQNFAGTCGAKTKVLVETVETEVKLDEMGVNDNEICGDRWGRYNFCPRASSPASPWRTRMWANAQPDGRPAVHRWRPLFNAAKFG